MLSDQASRTAVVVAFARAAGPVDVDPIAAELLPAPLSRASSWLRKLPEDVAAALTLGLTSHLAVRTRALDDALRRSVEAGSKQVVLLGAGLDSRAHRIAEVAKLAFFEVDHPHSQAYKRRRLSTRPEKSVYVPVNFEKDSLTNALLAAHFRADKPTTFIWEGVIPYLHPTAIDRTLADIAGLSAPGSQLLATYVTPEMSRWTEIPMGLGAPMRKVAHAGFHGFGEPLYGLLSPADFAARLDRVSLSVVSDRLLGELAPAHRVSSRWLHASERLLIASRP